MTESTKIVAGQVDPSQLDATRLRQIMSNFASGVVIATSIEFDKPVGLTIQSFASLSLNPPLCLICPSKTSTSWPQIRKSKRFVVNFLRSDQSDVAIQFGKRGNDKFLDIAWTPSPNFGAPVLKNAIAWIECRNSASYDGGDHTVEIGEIVSASINEENYVGPLIFYHGNFGTFEGSNDA